MAQSFTSFVVLAAMRTGSNFLEESLNRVRGLHCHGEPFNPVFIAYPDRADLFGVTQAARDSDPRPLLALFRRQPGLNGFRYFPDHDPRILDEILQDAQCAKIILGRNPLDSYISLKIARETGQWRLGGPGRRTAQVEFVPVEFAAHLDQLESFQRKVQHALQASGQAAFHVGYDDLGDGAVLAGLVRYLGLSARVPAPARKTLPQNPEPVVEKVTNPETMVAALAGLDPFRLGGAPNFEPRRGPGVPDFLAAARAPVLFMPVPGGPTDGVAAWLGRVGGGVRGGFSQSTLRQWMKANAPFRSFAVIRHPLHRSWSAFCRLFILGAEPDLAAPIARQWAIPSPAPADIPAQRAAFAAFLRFVKASLNGQTNLRVDASWASQSAILGGFGQFATPDMVLREATLQQGLGHLCAELGLDCPPPPGPADPAPGWLADPELERLARQAYGRDYVAFGFADFAG